MRSVLAEKAHAIGQAVDIISAQNTDVRGGRGPQPPATILLLKPRVIGCRAGEGARAWIDELNMFYKAGSEREEASIGI